MRLQISIVDNELNCCVLIACVCRVSHLISYIGKHRLLNVLVNQTVSE